VPGVAVDFKGMPSIRQVPHDYRLAAEPAEAIVRLSHAAAPGFGIAICDTAASNSDCTGYPLLFWRRTANEHYSRSFKPPRLAV
jgi:hypothetical protein